MMRESIILSLSRAITFGICLASLSKQNSFLFCIFFICKYSLSVVWLLILLQINIQTRCSFKTQAKISSFPSFSQITKKCSALLNDDQITQLQHIILYQMIELRSTYVEDYDGPKVELIDKKYKSNKSWLTEQQSANKKQTSPQSFKLIKTPLKRTLQQPMQNVDETVSNTSYRQNQPEEFKEKTATNSNFVFNNCNITDLTFGLINSKINIQFLTTFFFIQIVIRYFSIACLIFLMVQTQGKFWQWILIWMINNFLYFVAIVKISIKFPETQSETILKQSFNSLYQTQHIQYFQVIDAKKLWTSILRGLVPPELSFFYIKNMRTSERHLHIYVMINYIYSSIEAVIFYPFVIIYTAQVYLSFITSYSALFYISYAIIVLSQLMFISLSMVVGINGCKKKGYLKQLKQL